LAGASVLSLAGLVLIIIALAGWQYMRNVGKTTDYEGLAENERAKAMTQLIGIQDKQTDILRQNGRMLRRLNQASDMSTRKILSKLEEIISAQTVQNGDAHEARQLMRTIQDYIERKKCNGKTQE
jgi:hypothetical protein